ncbi:MAG: QueT transporter family protein [Actinomycetota bacterium]|nr:QueT transporter family protein [Actinomycetota bacterium]MDP9478947.1 QueT transporter family protein [Actinomycetota bacterium]MDP9487654.1 QueT transporter family protein [Actinomycetota bacterium]
MERGPARRVAVAGVVGALYVVLSLLVAPLAFGPVQFRLGEVLKPLVIKYPVTIPAFALGVGLVNLFSPVAGGLELILMPLVNLVGGVLCWFVAWRVRGMVGTYVASLLFALIIAAGVATVLHFAAGLPYLVAFGSVAASEVVLLFLGNAVLVRRV